MMWMMMSIITRKRRLLNIDNKCGDGYGDDELNDYDIDNKCDIITNKMLMIETKWEVDEMIGGCRIATRMDDNGVEITKI